MTGHASYADLGGHRIRYRADGSGRPVLLVHGIARSLEDFADQHRLLADRFRVYSVDLPGHGGSDPLPEPHTLPALAGALRRFLDQVGESGSAHVIGNSLGGAVAMRLAADAPDRVASLVLASSAGFGQEVTIALRILAIRPLGRLLLRPSRIGARHVVRSLFFDRSFVTEERVRHAYELAALPHAARVLLETGRSLGGFRGVRPQWREELLAAVAPLAIPTLVVWGDRDLILPPTHLENARARLPHARTHLFRDTGHMPQVERAAEFHELVTAFWAEQAYASR